LADGAKARFNNGVWEPVKVENAVCANQTRMSSK
jgi:hypothetical protein